MWKILLVGIWVTSITAGTTYAVGSGLMFGASKVEKEQVKHTEYIRLNPVTIPAIHEGRLAGYIVAQFQYAAFVDVIAKSKLPVDAMVLNRLYRSLYRSEMIAKLEHGDQSSLVPLLDDVVELTNSDLGVKMVNGLLIENINFVPKDMIRCSR